MPYDALNTLNPKPDALLIPVVVLLAGYCFDGPPRQSLQGCDIPNTYDL